MIEPLASPASALPADNRLALRRVARACRKAMLASLESEGAPYASLVTVALDHDLAPILLLSGLADHTRNLAADPRASLLFDGTEGHANPQTGPRVTLSGLARRVDDQRLKARFLARHPGAAQYAGFGDFAIWRVEPARAHFVGGFGRAVWFEAPFGLPPAVTGALAAAEAGIVAEINAGHAGLLDLLAHAQCGETGEGWRMVAIDPDGCDLALGERFARLAFPAPPVAESKAVTDALAGLARLHQL